MDLTLHVHTKCLPKKGRVRAAFFMSPSNSRASPSSNSWLPSSLIISVHISGRCDIGQALPSRGQASDVTWLLLLQSLPGPDVAPVP